LDAATGWKFSLNYLITGIVPNAGYWMLVRYSNFVWIAAKSLGQIYGLVTANFGITSTTNWRYYSGAFRDGSAAGHMAAGVVGVNNQLGYQNGIPDTIPIAGFDNINTDMLPIGARRRSDIGIWDAFITAHIQAFIVGKASITDVQMLAVSTAMAAL
jgi:hypothetical protein